jgi:hypothetical protein
VVPLRDKEIGAEADNRDLKKLDPQEKIVAKDDRLDSLVATFDQLMSVVSGLAVREDKTEKRPDTPVAGKENRGKSSREVVVPDLSLPQPSWPRANKDGTVSRGPTTQSLVRDSELSHLLDDYNADSDDMLHA